MHCQSGTMLFRCLLLLSAVALASCADWFVPMSIAHVASGGTVLYLTLSNGNIVLKTSPVSDGGQYFVVDSEWPYGQFTMSSNGQYLGVTSITNRTLTTKPFSPSQSLKWTYDEFGQIVSVFTGRRLTVPSMEQYTAVNDQVYASATIADGDFTQFASWLFVAYSPPPSPFLVSISTVGASYAGQCITVLTNATNPRLTDCITSDLRQTLVTVGFWPFAEFQLLFLQTGLCLSSNMVQAECNLTSAGVAAPNTKWVYNNRGQLLNKATNQCIGTGIRNTLVSDDCAFSKYTNRWIIKELPDPPAICFKQALSNGSSQAGSYYATNSTDPPCSATGQTAYAGRCYNNCKASEDPYGTGLTDVGSVPTACYTHCDPALWAYDNGAWCTNNPGWEGLSWPLTGSLYQPTTYYDCARAQSVQ